MDKNCTKYEGLFVFRNEEELGKHIEECSDCKERHEKEIKLSALIKEAAPIYRQLEAKQKRKVALVRAACALFLFVTVGTFTGFEITNNSAEKFKADSYSSVIEEEGLPIDEYGFFDYE